MEDSPKLGDGVPEGYPLQLKQFLCEPTGVGKSPQEKHPAGCRPLGRSLAESCSLPAGEEGGHGGCQIRVRALSR